MKKIREEAFKHRPRMEMWKKVVLFLPILMSVSWIVYLQYIGQNYAYYGMELLAPADTTPLMIALIIFTIGYVVFLLLMFSENIHDFIGRRLGH